jgi:nicotinamide phosphoribosyltransferase
MKIRICKMTEKEKFDLADIEYVCRLIKKVYSTGIVSIVADTFDYWNTITNTSKVLKDEIMNRDGKVVFRPDTGDPVKVVVGDEYAEKDSPEYKGSIECLWEIFGGKVNDKGFKELDSHVGLIYGDSISLERAEQICEGLKKKGFASTNIVFGIGSFTYQYATRDTDGYAVKATYAKINGVDKEIFKSPKGAEFKKSAKGLTAVFKDANGEFYLKDQATWSEVNNCEFVKVFENGQLIKDWTLQQVRNNLAQYV